MAKQSNDNLLTIGKIFKTDVGEFEILRKLGQGATGEVYQAQSRHGKRIVAIKFMRPTTIQSVRKAFIDEGLTLAQMRSVEKNAKDGMFVTPDYFGADNKTEPPYIVEEFMTGKPFPDLVSGGHLSEEDVVAIGVQLFRTLHLLSKELNKNYIDLKFENLWWDQEKKILKITDWGTLEETNPAGQARDILRASLYIYRLATGRPITESRGVLNQAVDAYPEWKQLSWGLQEILRRLLHPFPSARVGDDLLSLPSAEEITQAFKNLDKYWKAPPNELIKDAQRFVNAAKKADPEKDVEKQTLLYRSAKTALDIASHRNIANTQYDHLQKIVTPEADHFQRAYGLYEGTSYAPARRLFRLGARLLSSSKLRRWAWLAYAGELAREKNYSGVKALAEQAVELMEQEQYHDASISLDTALKTLQSEALQTLRQECEALNLVRQASDAQRDGKYKSAEDAYRSAHRIWIQIDEHDEWKDKVGDLLGQAEIVRIRGEKQEQVSKPLGEARAAKDLNTILEKINDALRLDPGNPEAYKLMTEKAGERFDAGLLEDAAYILWVGGIAPSAPPNASDWVSPKEVSDALIYKPLSRAAPYVAVLQPESLSQKVVKELLKKHYELAKDPFDLDRTRALAGLMKPIDSSLAEQWIKEIDALEGEAKKRNEDQVDKLIAEASKRLFSDEPGALLGLSMAQVFARLPNRLEEVEKALELLDQASRLMGSEDEASKSKVEDLKGKGESMKEELSQALPENKKQTEETIDVLKEKAEGILAQLEQLEDASPLLSKVGLPPQISDSMSGFQAERLGEVYELCTQVLDLDSENQWALQMQQNVKGKIQELGDYGTLAVVSQKNVLDAAVDALLREARDFYQNGRVLDTARSLRKIEALDLQASSREPFMELKAKVTTLLGVKYWEQENKTKLEEGEFSPQLLERIATHFSPEIPLQFRRDSASLKYLLVTRNKLFDQLPKVDPASSTSQFAEILRNLVWTDNLYSLGLTWQKNQIVSQKTEKWNCVKFVRNVLQAYKKGKFGQEMEKMLAGLPIFQNPEARSTQLASEVTHLVPEFFKPKPQRAWLKWALAGGSSLVVLGIIALLAVWNWNYILSILPGSTTPTASVAPVVIVAPTETPIETPTVAPTETPTFTETPIPTSVEVSLVPNYCIQKGGKIRSDTTAVNNDNIKLLVAESTCLYFDVSLINNYATWYRIAVGQKIGDMDVGDFWISSSFLTQWIPPTVTPTPSQ